MDHSKIGVQGESICVLRNKVILCSQRIKVLLLSNLSLNPSSRFVSTGAHIGRHNWRRPPGRWLWRSALSPLFLWASITTASRQAKQRWIVLGERLSSIQFSSLRLTSQLKKITLPDEAHTKRSLQCWSQSQPSGLPSWKPQLFLEVILGCFPSTR